MESQIRWAKGSRHKVKAEDAFQEIERIREVNGGLAKPSQIVDESRPDEAVLHPEFEWRDPVAAEMYRQDQARRIVQTLKIVQVEDEVEHTSPAIVSVVVDGERGYQPMSVVYEDADSLEFVLSEALGGLRAWRKRYHSLRSAGKLSIVWEALDKVLDETDGEGED